MERILRKFNMVVIISIASLVFDICIGGLLIFKSDGFTFNSNMMLVGLFILVKGLASLIRYVYDGTGSKFFMFDLFTGVSGVVLGLFSCLSVFLKDFTLEYSAIGLIFGVCLIIYAISKIYYGIKFRQVNEEIYPLVFMTGLLYLVIAISTIFNPMHLYIMYLIGILIIGYSVLEMNYCLLLRKRSKNFLNFFNK